MYVCVCVCVCVHAHLSAVGSCRCTCERRCDRNRSARATTRHCTYPHTHTHTMCSDSRLAVACLLHCARLTYRVCVCVFVSLCNNYTYSDPLPGAGAHSPRAGPQAPLAAQRTCKRMITHTDLRNDEHPQGRPTALRRTLAHTALSCCVQDGACKVEEGRSLLAGWLAVGDLIAPSARLLAPVVILCASSPMPRRLPLKLAHLRTRQRTLPCCFVTSRWCVRPLPSQRAAWPRCVSLRVEGGPALLAPCCPRWLLRRCF